MDKLVRDKDWYVRKSVAQHGRLQDLSVLANDPVAEVRNEVAEVIKG